MPAKGWKLVIEGVDPEVVAEIGNDVVIARHNAVPTSGATGTLAGIAGPGSVIYVSNGSIYVNTGTKASPTWVLTPRQGAAVADVASADADATYDAGEVALINEIKQQFNALLASLRAAGVIAP